MEIDRSLDDVLSRVDPPFADRFYELFLERFPRFRALFSETDWRTQIAMLNIGLQTIVQWYRNPTPATEEYLRLLGDKHRRFGIRATDLHDFGTALHECLARFHGESWTHALADQWSAAFNSSLAVIQEGRGQSDLHEGRLAHLSGILGDVHDQFGRYWHLLELTENINRGVLLDDVMNYVYEAFRDVIPFNRLGLSFITENNGTAVSSWAKSDQPIYLDCNYQAKLTTSTLADIVRTGRPRVINDLEKYLRDKPHSVSTRLIVREGMKSSLTCPLVSLGCPVGFLFFSSTEVETYKHAHVEFFQNIAGQLSVIVEKSRLYSQLQQQREQIEEHHQIVSQELEFARRFQRSLISQSSIDLAGLSIESSYEPASQIGGDLLEVVDLGDQQASLFVADAMGHGVKAAMMMAATKTALAHARRSTKDPGAILSQVNGELYDLLVQEGGFVTALCAVVNTSQRSLLVASAGHPFPWQYHAHNGEVSSLEASGGLPLGVNASENYPTASFPLEPEDAILMCTDGATEATNPDCAMYGPTRLAEILRAHGGSSARNLIQRIEADLIRHRKGVAADDDVTLVAVKWTGRR